MKKEFCSTCMKETNCKYHEEIVKETIDGIEIKYLEKGYICEACGEKVWGDYFDYNVHAANDELRKQTGLIRVCEIEEIIKKYNIGKKPLSLVLGLGEITIPRYIEGQNPSRENSDLLKMVLNNPVMFEMYLHVNKGNITDIAYKKSLGKTMQVELSVGKSKIYSVCLYIINSLNEIGDLPLQKMLFFANGLSKEFLNKHLLNDEAESWKYGPVYKDIYDCFSYYGSKKIDFEELTKNKEIDLSDEEKKYLDAIIDAFGFYSGSVLREMTHLTDPWINTREGLSDDEPSNRKITLDEMDKYFDKVILEYGIEKLEDITKYSTDLFEKAKENITRRNSSKIGE